MSRRGGFSTPQSGGGFMNFQSFVKTLPTDVGKTSNSVDSNNEPFEKNPTTFDDSQQNLSSHNNDNNKENNFNSTGGNDGYSNTKDEAFNESCSRSSEQTTFGNAGRGRGGFGSSNSEESSGHVNFGNSGRGRGGFGSYNNEESSGHVNFGNSGRGRGGFGSSNSEEASGHVNYGNSGRGRGGFGSYNNEESSGHVNYGSSGRGRGGFGSSNSEESPGHVNYGNSGRGRGGFGSYNNEEPSGHVNYGNSSRGRGGFGSSNSEESSGHVNYGNSGRGRGGFGSSNSEESSGHVNYGSSGRGRGGFGSHNNDESSGHRNYGNSGRGRGGFGSSNSRGRGGFGSYNNEESSGYANYGNSGRGRGGFGSNNNEESSGHVNFGNSGRGGRGSFNNYTAGGGNNDSQDMEGFLDGMNSTSRRQIASHVPVDRSVDVLLEEDKRNNVYYSQVVDQDDEVNVQGAEYLLKFDNWNECEFAKSLMDNIRLTGYVKPRNIQAYTMPQILNGYDVKGQAETGSGKTAAFLLPIINDIIENNYERKPMSPIAIIISPTRELALQTHEQARKFAANTGVTAAKCYGQYKITENIAEILRGCDILSSTPGRLKSFIENGDISLQCLKFFVLDEADELFNGSFVDTIRECLMVGSAPPKDKRINMLFSATFPSGVEALASELLNKNYVTIVNKCTNGANRKVVHTILHVNGYEKNTRVCNMLLEEKKEFEAKNQPLRRTLVFVSRKQQADMLSLYLCENGVKALSLNGDRPQKLREEALNDFRAHKITVLVTTDVCARGIDIKELDHVINVDLPKEFVTFVHRVGRTGRLCRGYATSFYDPNKDYELKESLVNLLRLNGEDVPDFLY
uniref:RNA helicase n=1 Tax=Strongyloides stercoralis TaxID=6248 RepID=A0A0K0EIT5_STRER